MVGKFKFQTQDSDLEYFLEIWHITLSENTIANLNRRQKKMILVILRKAALLSIQEGKAAEFTVSV